MIKKTQKYDVNKTIGYLYISSGTNKLHRRNNKLYNI